MDPLFTASYTLDDYLDRKSRLVHTKLTVESELYNMFMEVNGSGITEQEVYSRVFDKTGPAYINTQNRKIIKDGLTKLVEEKKLKLSEELKYSLN